MRLTRSPPGFGELLEPAHDRGVSVRLEFAKRERLHLGHHFVHADPLGERREDIHRLAGDAAAFVLVRDVMERPHVVQAVGELDQQDADVVAEREQEFAQVLGRALALRLGFDLAQLGDPVDEPGDVLAEQLFNLLGRRERVLDRVVEDRGGDGLIVEPEVGEDSRDLDRMAEIGVARSAHLRSMRLHREDVGAIDQALVRIGIVGSDFLDQLILPQHAAKMGRALLCKREREARAKDDAAPDY